MLRYSLLATAVTVLAVAASLSWAARSEPRDRPALHLSGDGATAVRPYLMSALGASVEVVDTAAEASVAVVLLSDWSKMRHIPEGAQMCAGACRAPHVLTRVIDLSPSGSSKRVFVDVTPFYDIEAGLSGDEAGAACLAEVLVAEVQELTRSTIEAACAGPALSQGRAVATRYRLPFGLGAVTVDG